MCRSRPAYRRNRRPGSQDRMTDDHRPICRRGLYAGKHRARVNALVTLVVMPEPSAYFALIPAFSIQWTDVHTPRRNGQLRRHDQLRNSTIPALPAADYERLLPRLQQIPVSPCWTGKTRSTRLRVLRGGRTRIRPPGFRLDCDGRPVLEIETLRNSFPGPSVELPIQTRGRLSGNPEGERKILHPNVRYRTERPRHKG